MTENIYFGLYDAINTFISNNIIDINSTRLNQTDPKKRKWVFASYPEKNDENYPRIAIRLGRPKFINMGGNNYLTTTEDSNGNTIKDNYGVVAQVTCSIVIFIKRDQEYLVAYSDNTIHPIRNQKQADYLSNEIVRQLEMNYDYFAVKGITIMDIAGDDAMYEDNDFTFATTISFTAELLLGSEINYASSDIIAVINENITVTT